MFAPTSTNVIPGARIWSKRRQPGPEASVAATASLYSRVSPASSTLAERSTGVVWYPSAGGGPALVSALRDSRAWLQRVRRALQPRRLRARLAAYRLPLDRADLSEVPATLEDVYRCYRLLLR